MLMRKEMKTKWDFKFPYKHQINSGILLLLALKKLTVWTQTYLFGEVKEEQLYRGNFVDNFKHLNDILQMWEHFSAYCQYVWIYVK